MAIRDEIERRVPAANREMLDVPAGASLFDATENGLSVDSVLYGTRTGQVLIGRAAVHQTLIDRYAQDTTIDEYVRADIFSRWQRIELDTMRAAVPVDPKGFPHDWERAWANLCDALDTFIALGLPDDWQIVIDGEEVSR